MMMKTKDGSVQKVAMVAPASPQASPPFTLNPARKPTNV